MSTVKGLRAGRMALVLIGVALAARPVSALGERFTTEQPASVLIFPKVVNTNTDTIIQITNTDNAVSYAHCFYVDGQEINGRPRWQVTDFDLTLTRQQPTHWSVADGRAVNPFIAPAGLDPGLIPPVVPGFSGFLVCVQVSSSGEPVSDNNLKGEGTVGTISALGGVNLVSKYNAIGIQACNPGGCLGGGVANDSNNVISLNNLEYAACPGGLLFNFAAEGGPDPAIDGAGNTPSLVSTNLTVVPCGMDFENVIPASTTLTLDFRNEFEEPGSVSQVPVDCYFSENLDAPVFGVSSQLAIGSLGSAFGTGILKPLVAGDLPGLGIANVLRTAGDGSADTAATNLHFCTDESAPSECVPVNSEIRLPELP